ncbi:MAG TPA: hypothetical protein VMU45_00815 [Candidatus Eisenbacteria bacterium]|nr:hypothetical protein [Candidatus Eisenbacteria bacterium]
MSLALPLTTSGIGQRITVSEWVRARAAKELAEIRAELLWALLQQMNAAEIPYCVLCGYEGYPDAIASDVDIMVSARDVGRMGQLLSEVALNCGALLVQAIRHETGAWYFVLAREAGDDVAYLHPDVSADYRRNGRLWLKADEVLQNRQRYRKFFVPAPPDEFQYYLLKKILKQHITGEQLQRLAALYGKRPEECSGRIRQFWGKTAGAALVSALVRQDLAWMRAHMPALLAELRESGPMEQRQQRAAQHWREWRRSVERAKHPTGLSIRVSGGGSQQRAELAMVLEQNLRPAFRRTRILAEDETGLPLAVWVWLAKVCSTLVIRKRAPAHSLLRKRDEICVEVSGAAERDAECATRFTLEWMAERAQKRMKQICD